MQLLKSKHQEHELIVATAGGIFFINVCKSDDNKIVENRNEVVLAGNRISCIELLENGDIVAALEC